MSSHLGIHCRRGAPPLLGQAVPSTLQCARRLVYVDPQAGTRAPPSTQTIKLRRALWMRMHPVERWTSLVDLGRRGAYLIEKAQAPAAGAAAATAAAASPSWPFRIGPGKALGSSDATVHFSEAATAAHHKLCAALPYAARLHLCLSLLMWVRCLRDVQDTLARVRLPFAMVRRPQRYAVAEVYPTRLSEYWVDVHTTVSTKLHAQLNSTAEQVPAPHTWNVETAETMEDAATESTITIDAGRVLHGRRQHRLLGKALLRQVQGVQPRASADDDVAARLTDTGSGSSRRRRRHRRLLPGGRGSTSIGPAALSTATAGDSQSPPRRTSLEFLPDAARRVSPVSLEAHFESDALYHGNTLRGEGCPISEDGDSTPCPIYIHVPSTDLDTGVDAEVLLRHCVMAHAAVLSSLYIEGRVVDFSTNNALVAAYVQWLLEELVADQYVNVTTVDPAAIPQYRPYFPAWCMRGVLVLLPPRRAARHQWVNFRGIKREAVDGYSKALLLDWAARIAQAAPCTVLVEGGEAAAAAYVQHLKDEVQRILNKSGTDGSGTAASRGPSSRQLVEWVPIIVGGGPSNPLPRSSEATAETQVSSEDSGKPPAAFRPQRQKHSSKSSFSAVTAALHLLSRRRSGDGERSGRDATAAAQQVSRQQRFLDAVRETLQDRFYMCEFLYSPTQSCLTPYRFERWVWEQLPDNVRVVGVNTAPLDVLFYFPQGVFLTQKVGNAFRYRAVERTIVAKDLVPSWSSHPLRYTATQLRRFSRRWLRWQRRGGGDVSGGLHAELSLADRCTAKRVDAEKTTGRVSATQLASLPDDRNDNAEGEAREVASHALVRERTVEYLAEPSKSTLLGLAAARFFRV